MRHASTNDSTSTLTRNANDKRDSGFASIYTPSPKRSIDDLQSLHSTEYDNGLWFNDPTKRTMEPEPLLVLDGLIHVPQRVYIPHKSNANFTKIPDNSQGAPAFAAKWEQHPATQSGTIGQKIQLRLEWPGYSSQYTSLNFRDFKKKSGPVAWEKFFERVTGAIRKMMQELEELKFNPEWSAWRVGKGYISPEDVVLLSIEHRSKGSWQPELYVRSRRDVHHPPLRHPTHPQYALQP
ncbi:hypothetical protein PsYK624_030490 [Phanerochaete sordida]|uniref:Uncharacterized protein n=1 Tax=Phanerochaete sordida TaxID=48140 RepID=A0A9P3L980_9APHY|nr:hypothetical protein PsYK624_030490 [Phanerochaete sordida]